MSSRLLMILSWSTHRAVKTLLTVRILTTELLASLALFATASWNTSMPWMVAPKRTPTSLAGYRRRQAVSMKGRQAGWDSRNRRDTTEERARSTSEAAVRKASHGKPSWGGEHTT